jgi:hypothetical protein
MYLENGRDFSGKNGVSTDKYLILLGRIFWLMRIHMTRRFLWASIVFSNGCPSLGFV